MRKRALSWLLALCVLLTMLPISVLAAEEPNLPTSDPTRIFENAVAWYEDFKAEKESNTLTWNTFGNAIAWWKSAKGASSLTDAQRTKVDELTTCYAGITELDMSNVTDDGIGGNAGKHGGLAELTNLESLDLSNTGITNLGPLAGLSKLKTLNISGNPGLNSEIYGVLVGLPLETLIMRELTGITSIGPLTSAQSGANCSDTLTYLDVSGTGLGVIQEVWNGGTSAPALPRLTTLVAQNLTLTSISGLTTIAVQYASFSADGITWDLTGSTLATDAENHVTQINNGFKGTDGNFYPPTVLTATNDPRELTAAENWKTAVETKLGSDAGKAELTWDDLITAVYWYRAADNVLSKMQSSAGYAGWKSRLDAIESYYASVTALDMSNKNTSKYAISTGVLSDFTGLTSLNLSNTGIKDTGGLAGLTKLELLDLSGNPGINDANYGALHGMVALKTLKLNGTGITDVGGLIGAEVNDTLTTLDISGTKVSELQSVWSSGNKFPALKTLTAQNLTLTSVTGLVEIANATDFAATGLTWNLGGSTLPWSLKNGAHIGVLSRALGDSFTAPTVTYPTITFDVQGGQPTDIADKTVDYWGRIDSLPDDPTKEYFDFGGWWTSASGGDQISTDYVFAADTTVYAHWESRTCAEHSWGEGVVTTPATSTQAGVKTFTCTVCGETMTESIPATGGGTTPPSSTTTTTQTNPDGSTTTTVTDKATGTVTGTTKRTDGTTAVVETKKDGTVTSTTTWTDGKEAVSVKKPDGETAVSVKTSTGETIAAVNIPAIIPAGESYSDVKSEDWFNDSVSKATGLGLFSGTGADSFSPQAELNRGMLVTVLHRLSGTTSYGVGENVFSDVAENAWYAEAADWADAAGVANGTGNGFAPEASITRQDMVTMIYRYAKTIGINPIADADLSAFNDSNSVSNYAQEAMQWAVSTGLISGKGNGILDPKGTATRAEVAAVLVRFVEYLKK